MNFMKKISQVVKLACMCSALLVPVHNLQANIWEDIKGYFVPTTNEAHPTIEVLIKHDAASAMIDVQGKYRISDPNTNTHITTRPNGKKSIFQPLYSGLKWGEEFPGVFQLRIEPERTDTPIYVDGVRYSGSLTIYDIGGSISIINNVPIEDYLDATLARTLHEPLNDEALSAYVIVARTNAYYYAKHRQNPYWSVDGDTVGYKGINVNPLLTPIRAAVQNTKNMVLSKTGAYEGVVTAFPAAWKPVNNHMPKSQALVYSKITLDQAENLDQNGKNAAQILMQAFPNSQINIVN